MLERQDLGLIDCLKPILYVVCMTRYVILLTHLCRTLGTITIQKCSRTAPRLNAALPAPSSVRFDALRGVEENIEWVNTDHNVHILRSFGPEQSASLISLSCACANAIHD